MPSDAADLAQLRAAINRAVDAIDARADPDAAYAAATAAGLLGQDLTEAAALARGRALSRIQEREGLSTAQLAARMGKSKTRVQQLMNPARKDHPPND